MSAKLIAAVFIAATSSAPLLAATTMIHVAMKVNPLDGPTRAALR